LDRGLSLVLRQCSHGGQGVLNIPDAGVPVIDLIKLQAALPVSLRPDVEVNARLLTPIEVGRDRNIALLGQFVAGLTDIGINPEQLLQNNDS
jgi:hypothetical protein